MYPSTNEKHWYVFDCPSNLYNIDYLYIALPFLKINKISSLIAMRDSESFILTY